MAGACTPGSFAGVTWGRAQAAPPISAGRARQVDMHLVGRLKGVRMQEVGDRRDHDDEREHLRADSHDARCAFYFRFGTSSRVIVYGLS